MLRPGHRNVDRLRLRRGLELAVTCEMAREIAAHAPLPIRGRKRILDMRMEFRGLPPGEAEEAEALIRRCMESRDLADGKKAFLEKRMPKFTGR